MTTTRTAHVRCQLRLVPIHGFRGDHISEGSASGNGAKLHTWLLRFLSVSNAYQRLGQDPPSLKGGSQWVPRADRLTSECMCHSGCCLVSRVPVYLVAIVLECVRVSYLRKETPKEKEKKRKEADSCIKRGFASDTRQPRVLPASP